MHLQGMDDYDKAANAPENEASIINPESEISLKITEAIQILHARYPQFGCFLLRAAPKEASLVSVRRGISFKVVCRQTHRMAGANESGQWYVGSELAIVYRNSQRDDYDHNLSGRRLVAFHEANVVLWKVL